MPLLVVQGEADELVRPAATQQYVTRMCAAGEDVEYRGYPGATHGTVVRAATGDVLAFAAAALAGRDARANCA